MHNRLAQGPSLAGLRIRQSCDRSEDKKRVCPWTTGARSGGLFCPPESTRASARGRFRMAAALRKQAAGKPGSRQRGKTAGSSPEACERKRIELWPIRGPPERQQDRLQASRGSCGQANDIGPGGSRSGRPYHRQVKSLAPEARPSSRRGAAKRQTPSMQPKRRNTSSV